MNASLSLSERTNGSDYQHPRRSLAGSMEPGSSPFFDPLDSFKKFKLDGEAKAPFSSMKKIISTIT